jgi:(p)ppGpp synthase/HD superfamily hydrolase
MTASNHDSLLLAAADALAAWLHREGSDLQGEPLIGHCRRVAATLREQGWPVEVQAAGLLHDAVEARHVRMDDLDAVFYRRGAHKPEQRVGLLVAKVTNHDGYDSYAEYIESVAEEGRESVAIKLADLRDNLDESRGPIPASLRKRYEKAVARLEAVDG